MRRSGEGTAVGAFFLWALFIVAIWVGVAIVAIHFIRKWW